jgi:hypothetical protein
MRLGADNNNHGSEITAKETTINLISRLRLAGALGLITPLGADSGDKKTGPEMSASLVTTAEKAALWGAEVLRAVAATERAIVDRRGTDMSTRMGKIQGGGMVTWASCKQRFSVSEVLAGAGKAGEREVAYSFLERAVGFPLPSPTRPVPQGGKVVLVLGVDGSLVKVVPDTGPRRIRC